MIDPTKPQTPREALTSTAATAVQAIFEALTEGRPVRPEHMAMLPLVRLILVDVAGRIAGDERPVTAPEPAPKKKRTLGGLIGENGAAAAAPAASRGCSSNGGKRHQYVEIVDESTSPPTKRRACNFCNTPDPRAPKATP